ncbi:MAG TPA: DUF2480 family protein [Flavobacteriaceae bacterium]|nr:DUF2480 family protein [Flavobacteriaceae bacterium]
MTHDIVNRVANSKLITLDLEDFYTQEKRVLLDIKDWLYESLILKEKEFRKQAEDHDWNQYKNTYVALTCSVDAIIPSWAYLLIATKLAPFAKKIIVGDLTALETSIYEDIIKNLDVSVYENKPVIVKGCSNKAIPATAYTLLIQKLQPVAKSIMYGEACSSVPLYKNKT